MNKYEVNTLSIWIIFEGFGLSPIFLICILKLFNEWILFGNNRANNEEQKFLDKQNLPQDVVRLI